MSLINQMLKDLEQRGAGIAEAQISDVRKEIPFELSTTGPLLSQLFLIKTGGLIVLLAGGVYLWMQSAPALSHNADQVNATPLTVNPKPIDIALAESTVAGSTIKLESKPLFETELKYKESSIWSVAKQTQKEHLVTNLVQNAVSTKLVNQKTQAELITPEEPTKESTKLNNVSLNANLASGKSTSMEHTALKPSAKSNTDNAEFSKQIRPDQKSANYYRQALSNLQQGRVSEAQANLVQAIEANPANQEARQTLAGLLIDNKRNDEARETLTEGLVITPEQSDFRMALARLLVESGDRTGALNTLEQGLPYAKSNADYQSFLATMLQRAERHEEAINHYTTALTLNSAAPNSLIGLGISLQAVGKLESAQEAFSRAQSIAVLSPELSLFVEQRLKQINQRLHN